MFYHSKSDKYIDENSGIGFIIDDMQFPPNWLNITSKDDREAAGFLEVIRVGTPESDTTHFVSESRSGNIITIVNTPKPQSMLDQIVESEIEQIKSKTREMREQILNRLAGIALAANLVGDTALVNAYVAARQSLLDITKDLPSSVSGVQETIMARYQSLAITAITAAPSLESAFNSMDI